MVRHLPIADLVRMLVVCKTFRTLATKAIHRKVHGKLQEWIGEKSTPREFLDLLKVSFFMFLFSLTHVFYSYKEHGGVVTGDPLLSLLFDWEFGHNWNWDTDLIIFVPKGHGAQFADDLQTLIGGDLPYVPFRESYGGYGIARENVQTMWHKDTAHEFYIIESKDESALLSIPTFHNTLAMNFLAFDHICVAYPKLTLQGIGCMHPKYFSNPFRLISQNSAYEASGFRVRYPMQPDGAQLSRGKIPSTCPVTPSLEDLSGHGLYTCPQLTREFYDKYCMILPFNGISFVYPNFTCKWELGGIRCGGTCYRCGWNTGIGSGKGHLEGSVKCNRGHRRDTITP